MLYGACAHINTILDLFVRSIASPKMDFKALTIRRSYTTVDESSVNIHSVVPLVNTYLTASTAMPISSAAPIPADISQTWVDQ